MPDDPDQIQQMSVLISCGWVQTPDGWRHPAVPNLPPLTTAQAAELQEQADLDLRQFDPAQPPRIH